jgi:membrane protein YdbS with pleckstrin-like domain
LVGLGSIPISLLFTTRKFGGHTWIVVIGPILAFGFAALSWWIADRQFRAWSYQLSERELVLSHGLLFRTRRTVPRGRVQHIDINSGPLDRKFGLVQVCIYVAGAMGSIGAIPGLTPERAEELKAAIIEGRDIHA